VVPGDDVTGERPSIRAVDARQADFFFESDSHLHAQVVGDVAPCTSASEEG
jgi:hypothetical protein